jgi:hypothetical protein
MTTLRIEWVAQIMRQRIHVDTDLVASFGNLRLFLGYLYFSCAGGLIVSLPLKFPQVFLALRS